MLDHNDPVVKKNHLSLIQDWKIAYDIVFVLNINSKGWILEKICNMIAEASGKNFKMIYTERNDIITTPLPAARAYFFAHYALYTNALEREPFVSMSPRYVWFTHPSTENIDAFNKLISSLKVATIVFTANTIHRKMLIDAGVDSHKVVTVIGGADANQFKYKKRGDGVIGFVTAYYERKNPDGMLQLMRRMSNHKFCLVGPSPNDVENTGLLWKSWSRYSELEELDNLKIYESEYCDFPKLYDQIDVYVSLSSLEGGPIPLIEAMQANAVPVVTKTGFAEDIITEGVNGFLIDVDFNLEQVVTAVQSALSLSDVNIRETVENLTWRNFGAKICDYMFNLNSEIFTSIKMNTSDNKIRYSRYGFGPIDTYGLWQINRQSLIVVERQKHSRIDRILITFYVSEQLDIEKVRLKFLINGKKMLSNQYKKGKTHTADIVIPSTEAAHPRYNITLFLDLNNAEFSEGLPILRIDNIDIHWGRKIKNQPELEGYVGGQAESV